MSSITFYNNKNNHTGTRKRRRGHGLIGLVCLSLCANNAAGFENFMHPSRQPQPQLASVRRQESSMLSFTYSSTVSSMASETGIKNTQRRSNFDRLTPEEEKDVLAKAVEFRRLNQLEKDLALTNQNKLPMLSIRAKHAGYGEDLDGYEDAKLEGQLARETLVTHNMGLVHHCVNKIIGRQTNNRMDRKDLPLNSLSRDDLVQEGAIGLARAVDKWNPEIGGKFSTYAMYWVRAMVLRCIAERDDVVRVPHEVSQAVVQINKAAKRMGWTLQESGGILVTEKGASGTLFQNPNSPRWQAAHAAKLLAEEAGLSERSFEEAMKVRRRRYGGGYVPFESWMQKTGKNGSLLSQHHQSDENVDYGQQRLESEVANEGIRTVLSQHLKPKEMEALSWRYGLLKEEDAPQEESMTERANRQLMEMESQLFGPSAAAASAKASLAKPRAKTAGVPVSATPDPLAKGKFGEAMTFTEVGKKMQVSAEYTRRLCHKALGKLQQAAEEGTLEPALLF